MGISRVQGPVHGRSVSSTAISCVFAGTPAVNNVIVAVISTGDYSSFYHVNSISQSGVNWSVAPAGKIGGPAQFNDGGSDLFNGEIWLGIVTGAGASKTVSVTLSGAPAEGAIVQACEYTGVKITGTITDGVNTHTGHNAVSTGSILTTNANDLIIGVWAVYENLNQALATYLIDKYGTNGQTTYWAAGYMLEQIVSSTGTYGFTSTEGSSVTHAGVIVALKSNGLTLTSPYSIDTSMKATYTNPYNLDTVLKKFGVTQPNLIDVDLEKLGTTQTYPTDTLFFGSSSTSFDIDTFIRNIVTITTNTNKIDALLNSPYPYKIDTDFKKFKATKTDSIDVLYKELNVKRTVLIDTLFAKTRQYFADAYFRASIPVQYALDVDFKVQGVQVQYIIDSRFIKTYTSTYAIDMMMATINFSASNDADSLFQKLAITTSSGVDTNLLSNIPPIPPIYAQPTLMFANPNGQLWVFPLTWKEIQNCTPAIRPIPLGESEYLDADSYVLKSREIDVTFRISDSEKTLLEEIYGFADTQGANDFTDIYLYYNNTNSDIAHPKPPASVPQYTWHYSAWLSNKDYKYEYAYQDGRYVRWWTVTLTINVENFSGSSANEPENDNPFAMAVVLDGHELVHILDFERSDEHPPMLPEWVDQPAEVDSYLWNECVLDLAYTDKMSNDEKYLMDLTLQNHQLVYFTDYIHNVQGAVWVSSITATYDSSNWAKPWNVDIALQANNSDVNFNAQANVSVESWGVDSIDYDDIGPDNLGTLYVDEVITPLTLPSGGNTMQCGVHTFYFFLPNTPNVVGFYTWSVSGNAVIVGEDTYDIQTFDRESRVSVLIYGDCTVIPEYIMATTPVCFTIALDSALNDTTITNAGSIQINGSGSGCLPDDFSGPLLYEEEYTLEYIGAYFVNWEVVCGDVTIDDVNAPATTFEIHSGNLAWIRAIYDPVLTFTSHNNTYNTDNNGAIWLNLQFKSLPYVGHYSDVESGILQFSFPNVCQDQFITWWTDNPTEITFDTPTNPFCHFIARGSGTIKAIFTGPNS